MSERKGKEELGECVGWKCLKRMRVKVEITLVKGEWKETNAGWL